MSTQQLAGFAAAVQHLLYQLMRNFETCDRLCLAQYGVTASQGYTLLALPQGGGLSMNELSEAMGLANSTMTRMVDHLVSKGLVCRQTSQGDRRVVLVALSTRGQQVRDDLELARQELFQSVLVETHQDERPRLLQALEKLIELTGKAMQSCCSDPEADPHRDRLRTGSGATETKTE